MRLYKKNLNIIQFARRQNRPLTTCSHLAANLKARLAELPVIFPIFGIPRIQESCKSVRALGDTELEETTPPLNEKAHQSCIIKRGGKVGGQHKVVYECAARGGITQSLTWVVGHWRLIKTAGLAHFSMLK